MQDFPWLTIIVASISLLLLFPVLRIVFRQPGALRNVVIWVAAIAALIFAYLQFGHLLPENVQRNMGGGPARTVVESNGESSGDTQSLPAETAPTSDGEGPVRNL
jgi:hypothetical protein